MGSISRSEELIVEIVRNDAEEGSSEEGLEEDAEGAVLR